MQLEWCPEMRSRGGSVCLHLPRCNRGVYHSLVSGTWINSTLTEISLEWLEASSGLGEDAET